MDKDFASIHGSRDSLGEKMEKMALRPGHFHLRDVTRDLNLFWDNDGHSSNSRHIMNLSSDFRFEISDFSICDP
jgi:hypothetical protein